MTLAYTRSGSPNAPAVVFLHGMAMGQWMWFEQVQHFADYDCYNVDLPGHGNSHSLAWESIDETADCVARLITTEIDDKPVYLVGMSLGAVVGLHLLTRYSGRIAGAVLTGAVAETPPRWMTTLQSGLLSVLLRTSFGKQLFARTLQIPADAMPYYLDSINAFSLSSFRRMSQQIATYRPPSGLETITTPTLFVTGDQDVGVNRRAVSLLAQRVPGAVGVLAPGVHHGWNGEAPDLFNQMTRAWFEKQPLPQRLIPVTTNRGANVPVSSPA